MNRAHYLKTDIRRLIKNYPIYLGIVGVAISMWFSLEDSAFTEGMVNGNALDTYDLAVSMSGIMIAYAFCAFSYATVFCEDLEYKYARYSINRGNTWKYVVSKAVVVYGASVITMVLGSLARMMNLVRSTVYEHRKRSLELMKEMMEEYQNEQEK